MTSDIPMADIKAFDLNLLRTLDALLETRSVTRAADRLGVTQPAVSGMLARLREALDDPLFIRTQRGILPTPRAEALAGSLKAALAQVEALLEPEVFDPARAALTLRIAATDYAQRAVVLPFMDGLRREAPSIRLSVRPVVADFPQQLAEGDLDLALVTSNMSTESLRTRGLFDESYVAILRDGHPAASRPLDLDSFCALDHAIMSHDGTELRGATDDALERVGRKRNVVISLPGFAVLIDLIRRSDLIAMIPRRLLAGEGGIVLREPPVLLDGFRKILVWHERLQHDPAQAWLRQRLADSVSD